MYNYVKHYCHYTLDYQNTFLGSFVHDNFLKPHFTSHNLMYFNSLAAGAIPHNSKIFYVAVK